MSELSGLYRWLIPPRKPLNGDQLQFNEHLIAWSKTLRGENGPTSFIIKGPDSSYGDSGLIRGTCLECLAIVWLLKQKGPYSVEIGSTAAEHAAKQNEQNTYWEKNGVGYDEYVRMAWINLSGHLKFEKSHSLDMGGHHYDYSYYIGGHMYLSDIPIRERKMERERERESRELGEAWDAFA